MKKLTVFLIALLLFAVPVFAQEDEGMDFCQTDVSDAVAALEALQAEFDSTADLDKYLEGLEQVIAELESIRRDCLGPMALTQEYVGEHLAITIPEGWIIDEDGYDVLIIASSENALDLFFVETDPVFTSGEFGMGVFGNVEETFGMMPEGGDPFREIADLLLETIDDDLNYTFSEPEFFSVNDRRALRIGFVGTGIEAALIVLDLGDNHFAVFVPATAVGELADFESTLMGILESARYIP